MKIHAVFEGGGVKGIALAGAVAGAMQEGISFDQVVGTSSGAITAAFLAAGYHGDEMKQMILETPFQCFLKRSRWFDIHAIGPLVRLWIKKGLYSSEALENWVYEKLKAKRIYTFGDLRPNQLRIIASDISKGKLLVLPEDMAPYGFDPRQFSVARAVRMSASIPYFFDPVYLSNRSSVLRKKTKPIHAGSYIVDGALLSNFPLWVFENQSFSKNQTVVGFQLVGRNESRERNITGPISMMQALVDTMLTAHDERYIEKNNRFRTVKIPTLGVRSTQFDLSKSTSLALFQSGYEASRRFFQHGIPRIH